MELVPQWRMTAHFNNGEHIPDDAPHEERMVYELQVSVWLDQRQADAFMQNQRTAVTQVQVALLDALPVEPSPA